MSNLSVEQQDKKTIWEKFVEGEESYFDHLFKAYYDDLYNYGLKLSSRPMLVEDCLQDLFKNIWNRRDDLDHIHSPNIYFYIAIKRRILRSLKHKRRNQQDLSLEELDVSITFNKEELIVHKEVELQQKKELERGLNKLTNRQKEIVYLHFFNGMGYGEIASILSINHQSVKNAIYRAMECLRTVLDEQVMKLLS